MASGGSKPNRVGGSRSTKARALIEQARRRVQDGKRAEAEATLLRVIADSPKNREAHFLLADVQNALGKQQDALVTLRAMTQDPTDAAAHYKLGLMLRE